MAAHTRQSVLDLATQTFPHGDLNGVMRILDEYDSESEAGRARVQIAVLKLSEGDFGKLRHFTQQAILDFRDVLYWTEYSLKEP